MISSTNKTSVKVIFCVPGNNFSGSFLDSWTDTIFYCLNNGIQPVLSRQESNNIYFVRNMCLGGEVTRGQDQRPFDGKIDYDYLMWIDSDMVFRPQHIKALLDHNQDIVAGTYVMADGKHVAAVKEWDEEYFKKQGNFEFLTLAEIFKNNNALLEVAYTGFGFILIRKGVFEKMEYPWFRPIMHTIGAATDFCAEDVGFCRTAQKLGFKIYIDPSIRVGHQKQIIL